MVWFVVAQLFTLMLDILTLHRQSEHEKDIEILLLRQQLRIVERKQPRTYQLSRWDKLNIAVLTARFKAITTGGRERLREVIRLVQPETVLRWHRDLAGLCTSQLSVFTLGADTGKNSIRLFQCLDGRLTFEKSDSF